MTRKDLIPEGFTLTKEQIELIVSKITGMSDESWNNVRESTGFTFLHKDTVRKGALLLKVFLDLGVISIVPETTSAKKIQSGKLISEVVQKYCDGDALTSKDLLKLHKLKTGEFRIKSAKSSVWGSSGNENISSSITYEPTEGVSFDDIEGMYESLTPKKLTTYKPPKREDKIIEMIPADLHFNKIAYDKNGEIIWDTNIAAGVMAGYTEYMCNKGAALGADKCIFIWSNDFFNSESSGATVHGTPQRNDKTPEKAFELGTELMIGVIELLRSTFKEVEVIYVPSNHDKSQSFNLSCLLKRYFENADSITFDNSPTAYRKYRSFGVNTNGYRDWETDRKSTRLNSSHSAKSRMPSSA